MLDVAPELVKELKAVLPTYAEPVDKKTPIPCITYQETNRRDLHALNGMQYTVITMRVRVWTTSRRDMASYADQAETVLRGMGWSVAGVGEQAANDRYCKILSCNATGQETKTW